MSTRPPSPSVRWLSTVAVCLAAAAVAAGGCARASAAEAVRVPAPVASNPEAPFDAFVEARMATFHRPGVAIAITRDGDVVWRHAYGFADLERRTAVTASTVFPVCSLSKPVLLVAVMQVVARLARERGTSLDVILDENVEDLLPRRDGTPMRVRHPAFVDTPISLRMLLTHLSGIRDHYALAPHHVPVTAPSYASGELHPFDAALRDYIEPEGRYFDRTNFALARPGTEEVYSSVASSIAALVVEAATGSSFEDYTRSNVFDAAGMVTASWRLAEVARRSASPLELALPYQWKAIDGGPLSIERVSPSIWEHTFFPAASLRSTADDYARFVAAFAGVGGHSRLVDDPTFHEILAIQHPEIAPTRGLILGWVTRAGLRVVGHSGQNEGYRTEMFFTPPGSTPDASTWGVVVLTNGDYTPEGETFESIVGSEALRLAMRGRLLR